MKTYDLTHEEENRIREAEKRHTETEIRKMLCEIREALQANNALLMGYLLRV